MAEEYRKARKSGAKQAARARAQGKDPYPPALDDVLGGRMPAGEVSMGLVEVPLELVAGTRSRGRQSVFSPDFLPVAEESSEFALKWSQLLEHQKEEGIRDPIVAYEYLQRFYVAEGNKRVSVARYLDMPQISAIVTRVLPPEGAASPEELARYREFMRFYAVAPIYAIFLSHPGDYLKLARLLGKTLDEPWSEDEVKRLSSVFALFARAYAKRTGEKLELSASDAFLAYLEAYADAEPLNISSVVLEERVRALMGEFELASRKPEASYAAVPLEGKGRIASAVTGIVRGTRHLKAAFIYDRDPATSGWVAMHEQGRAELERRLGDAIETSAVFDCASDESFSAAVDAAEADGCTLIFTPSARQAEQSLRAGVAHPKLTIVNNSLNFPRSSVRTYHARMYEVKFALGALAASCTETHHVGYAAFSPIFGTVAEVNAFAAGVALVDPKTIVHLRWLTAEDGRWRERLSDFGVDVVSGRDYPDPADENEPFGLFRMDASGACVQKLATPVWDWGRYLELIVRSIQDDSWTRLRDAGKGDAVNLWWGLAAGVVGARLAPELPASQKRLVELIESGVAAGVTGVFDGVFEAEPGVLVQGPSGVRWDDASIAAMSPLMINIEGRIPLKHELSSAGEADVAVAAVSPAIVADGAL